MNHRDLIRQVRRQMKSHGLTAYQLHRQLKGRVSKQTVYNFVEHGKVIKSDTLIAVLNALDLTITRK